MTIAKNDFVIFNDFDCPEPRMIVLVSSVHNGIKTIFRGRYISTENLCNRSISTTDEPTKVSDFGINISMVGSNLVCKRSKDKVVAKYQDGKSRTWQSNYTLTSIKMTMLKRVSDALMGKE